MVSARPAALLTAVFDEGERIEGDALYLKDA